MSNFFLSQVLVSIAICTDLISFQFKQKAQIISVLLVSATLISVHFMLLGHWTAAGLALLASVRFVVSLLVKTTYWRYIFIAATLMVAYFTYEGLLSIISTTAAVLGSWATFCPDDRQLRKIMGICTSLWIIHNIIAGSPGAVIVECLFLGSNIVGYFRYYIRPQKQSLS